MFLKNAIMLQVANTSSNWSNTFNILGQLFYLLFIIVLVFVIAYFLIKVSSSLRLSKTGKKNLEIVESMSIGFQCSIQLIKVSEKYILIALSKDKITFLAELSKDEIKIEDDTDNISKNVFSDYLSKYAAEIIKKTKKTND